MKVTFLAHSAFLVEWDSFYTLFDYVYYEDYTAPLPALDARKPLLVFSSHAHEDHFDPRVMSLHETYPLTQYFLSRDISMTERRRKWLNISDEAFARTVRLRADEIFITEAAGEELTVRTVKSTDVGNAYLLSCEGKLVYHAGDCNWWNWESEGKGYCTNMTALYCRAMEKLSAAVRDEAADRGIAPVLTAAMAVLDPRLELSQAMGLEKLCESVDAAHIFPMHLWSSFGQIDAFCDSHAALAPRIARITHNGQTFEI